MKKTAKRRPAKKAPNKASKAIEEALGTFKPPTTNEPAPAMEDPVNDADEWTEYGPLGGQDEDAIAREVLGMELGITEEPIVEQEVPSKPSEPTPAQVVPELPAEAPQAPAKAQSKSPIATCILNLIDALNFLHREGYLRKLPEKDILILKQRIKTGRQLIEKL